MGHSVEWLLSATERTLNLSTSSPSSVQRKVGRLSSLTPLFSFPSTSCSFPLLNSGAPSRNQLGSLGALQASAVSPEQNSSRQTILVHIWTKKSSSGGNSLWIFQKVGRLPQKYHTERPFSKSGTVQAAAWRYVPTPMIVTVRSSNGVALNSD